MSKAKAEHVAAAHARQLKQGWRRLGLRLKPEPSQDLEWLVKKTGHTPTEVIARALLEYRRKLA